MRQKTTLAVSLLFLSGFAAFAQESAPTPELQTPRYYRLDFAVNELQDRKLINSRKYFVFLKDSTASNDSSAIRAESNISLPTGKPEDGHHSNSYRVGVKIDCRYKSETKDHLGLNINVSVDSVIPDPSSDPYLFPITRTNQWSSEVLVQRRVPTVIFSSDDPASQRKIQIELIATPLNP